MPNDDKLIRSMSACVDHARDLLEAAKAVQATDRPNIAYHLATLALEELGRREILQMQAIAAERDGVPAWQQKATQDHVKKLFWCFYRMQNVKDVADQEFFFETLESAADIHSNRLSGLYVEASESSLNVPSEAIDPKQAQALISLAELYVSYAESEVPRDVPQEEIDLQRWLLDAFDDPNLRPRLLTVKTINRLKELNNVGEWVREIKSEIEAEDEYLRDLADKELKRLPNSNNDAHSTRWKIRIKIRSLGNSIHPGALKKWNRNVKWIKLYPQQGTLKNEEMFAEFFIDDRVPIAQLWPIGISRSIQFLMALNFATSGFWWWPLAPYQQKFYDKVTDLENNMELKIEDSTFRVFDKTAARGPKLTEVHIDNLISCLAALPSPDDPKRAAACQHYLSGLTFISLNSIQWRCEDQAFLNFLKALKLLMVEAQFKELSEPADLAIKRLIKDTYPALDQASEDQLLSLIREIEARRLNKKVTLGDVYFVKLLCETLYRDKIVPAVLRSRENAFKEKDARVTNVSDEG